MKCVHCQLSLLTLCHPLGPSLKPLPSSLQLIRVNSPDLVLFVGEALVGNEAVDQLVKFNRALADHSDAKEPRLIDGILLTKFDTIDDKVCVCTCVYTCECTCQLVWILCVSTLSCFLCKKHPLTNSCHILLFSCCV